MKEQNKPQEILAMPCIGKDEMNLAEFPIALLSERNLKARKTIKRQRNIVTPDGRELKQEWIVTGSDEYGLPLAQDDDVLMSILEAGAKSDFESRTIYFNRHTLIAIMGWDNQGWSYKRIIDALNRLSGVRIVTKNAFYDKDTETYLSRNFGIIDGYQIFERRYKKKDIKNQLQLSLSYVRLSEELYQSIKSGYVKYINTKFYYSLSSSVSKRLYRYLDKKRYQKKEFEINLLTLAEVNLGLDLSTNCYPSQIKRQLNRAHKELREKGFLKKTDYKKTKDGKSWKVVYTFGEEATRQLSLAEPREDPNAQLIAALVERGMTERVARKLIDRYSPEVVEEKIDILDFLIKMQSSTVLKNPAGWLRRAIEENYLPPAKYKTKAEREKAEQAEKQEKAKLKEEKDKEAALQRRTKEAKDKLSSEELEKLTKEAEELCRMENTFLGNRPTPKFLLDAKVNELIKKRCLK